jgi:hypothetical protein
VSIFDSVILKSFNEHLELTLGFNQNLYQQYPYYMKMINGLEFKDPQSSNEHLRDEINF